MSRSDGVYITLGADASDLQAALAKSGASLDDLSNKARAATTSFSGINAASASAQRGFTQVTSAAAQTGYGLLGTAGASSTTVKAWNEVGEAGEKMSLSTAGARRELIVLAHEMALGNYSRFGGSLMVLAERMGGVSLGMMGAAGAVAALGYGLYEVIDRANQANAALNGVVTTMANMGNAPNNIGVIALQGQLKDLTRQSGVTKEEAAGIVSAMESIPQASDNTRRQLERLTATMAVMNKEEPEKTAERLSKAFSSISGIEELTASLRLLTAEERRQLDLAKEFGNLDAAQQIGRKGLDRRYQPAAPYARAYNEQGSASRWMHGGNVKDASGNTITPDAGTAPVESPFERQSEQAAKTLPQTTATVVAQYREQAEAAGKTKEEIDTTAVEMWKNVLATTQAAGAGIDAAQKGLLDAQAAARRSASAQLQTDVKAELSAQSAAGRDGHTEMLAAQVAADRRLLADKNASAEVLQQRQIQFNSDQTALRQAAGADAIAEEKGRIAELEAAGDMSRAQILAEEVEGFDDLIKARKLSADQQVEIEREKAQAIAQLHAEELAGQMRQLQEQTNAQPSGSLGKVRGAQAEVEAAYNSGGGDVTTAKYKEALTRQTQGLKEYETEQQAIRKQGEDTAVTLAKIGFQAEKDRLDEEVAAGDTAASRKLDRLRELADQEYQLQLQSLARERDGHEQGTRAWQAAQDRILILSASYNAQLDRLDAQQAQARAAMVHEWTAPVGSAMNTMLAGYMQGTLTMNQLAARSAQSIALSYASKFGDIAEAWFEKHVLMAAWDSLFAAKSVATTTSSEAAKTGVVAAAQTAQTGAVVAGQAAQTTAVVAGGAAQVTAQAAASDEGLAMKVANGIASVAIDAYTAATGAYSAIAAIPIVGPILAPVAAATALAAVFAIGAHIASAEGGWDEVDRDGRKTVLHKEEMVLSAKYANPLRAMLTGSSAPAFGLPPGIGRPANSNLAEVRSAARGGSGGGEKHVHLHGPLVQAIDTQTGAQFLLAHVPLLAERIARYQTRNPSSRPEY